MGLAQDNQAGEILIWQVYQVFTIRQIVFRNLKKEVNFKMNQARNIAMLFVVATALVLMSCAGKQTQTPTTETYYETEYRTETYTEVEDVVVGTTEGSQILSTKAQWKSTYIGFFEKGEYWTDYYGYDISKQAHTHRQVQISLKINPQLNKGAIEVVNLTDACSDKNIKSIPNAGQAFGKEPTGEVPGGQYFIPTEGCQLLTPYIVEIIWL
jgi:hypothetical protein